MLDLPFLVSGVLQNRFTDSTNCSIMKSNSSRWIGVPHFFMKFLRQVMLPVTVLQDRPSQSCLPSHKSLVMYLRAQLVDASVSGDDVRCLRSFSESFHLFHALVQFFEVAIGSLLPATTVAVPSLGIREGEEDEAEERENKQLPHDGDGFATGMRSRIG